MTRVTFGFWGWGLSGPEYHRILPAPSPLLPPEPGFEEGLVHISAGDEHIII